MEREDINPWLHIWTQPRKTMRAILDKDPKKVIIWLALLSGALSALIVVLLNWYPYHKISHRLPLFFMILVMGALIGILLLYFVGWLLTLTGSWLAGKGSFTQVKSAVGWGNYPHIVANLLGLIRIFVISHFWPQIILGIAGIVTGIWAFIISLKLIGEAHQFSAWKSLLAIVISFILVFVAIMIVALLVPLLKPLFQ